MAATSSSAGRRSCELVREYPRSTATDRPIGHAAGTTIPSMRTTGSVVDRGHVRRLRGLPGSGVTARCQPGCCTIVLHVGILTLKCQLLGPLRPEAKFGGGCSAHECGRPARAVRRRPAACVGSRWDRHSVGHSLSSDTALNRARLGFIILGVAIIASHPPDTSP